MDRNHKRSDAKGFVGVLKFYVMRISRCIVVQVELQVTAADIAHLLYYGSNKEKKLL